MSPKWGTNLRRGSRSSYASETKPLNTAVRWRHRFAQAAARSRRPLQRFYRGLEEADDDVDGGGFCGEDNDG